MLKESITLVGVGDVIIDRDDPASIFWNVSNVLNSADIAYANCEQPLSDKGTPNPKQAVYSSPKNLDGFLSAGFDVVSLANNHALDWGTEALLDTISRLDAARLPHVGAGANIAQARQPVILERKGTRVGFLSYSSVHMDGYEAGIDSPGLAPIRIWTIYERVDYQPGTPPRIVSFPYKEDLEGLTENIKRLKAQVDIVVLCMHWGQHLVPAVIPMYCFELGHAAIDAGVDIILGTHTHILKGIEIYHGKPIFYSTANFALELGSHMRDHKHVGGLNEFYKITDETERRNTLIAKFKIEDGRLARVSYIPCYINEKSEPVIQKRSDSYGQQVFDYIKNISESEKLNVHFAWEGDEVLVLP
jgi:hypothetical protein